MHDTVTIIHHDGCLVSKLLREPVLFAVIVVRGYFRSETEFLCTGSLSLSSCALARLDLPFCVGTERVSVLVGPSLRDRHKRRNRLSGARSLCCGGLSLPQQTGLLLPLRGICVLRFRRKCRTAVCAKVSRHVRKMVLTTRARPGGDFRTIRKSASSRIPKILRQPISIGRSVTSENSGIVATFGIKGKILHQYFGNVVLPPFEHSWRVSAILAQG